MPMQGMVENHTGLRHMFHNQLWWKVISGETQAAAMLGDEEEKRQLAEPAFEIVNEQVPSCGYTMIQIHNNADDDDNEQAGAMWIRDVMRRHNTDNGNNDEQAGVVWIHGVMWIYKAQWPGYLRYSTRLCVRHCTTVSALPINNLRLRRTARS